jgi:hypothetical protein
VQAVTAASPPLELDKDDASLPPELLLDVVVASPPPPSPLEEPPELVPELPLEPPPELSPEEVPPAEESPPSAPLLAVVLPPLHPTPTATEINNVPQTL